MTDFSQVTLLGNPATMEFIKFTYLMGLPLLAYLVYDIVSTDRQPKLWRLQPQKNRP